MTKERAEHLDLVKMISKNDNFKRADWTMIEHEPIVS